MSGSTTYHVRPLFGSVFEVTSPESWAVGMVARTVELSCKPEMEAPFDVLRG